MKKKSAMYHVAWTVWISFLQFQVPQGTPFLKAQGH